MATREVALLVLAAALVGWIVVPLGLAGHWLGTRRS